MASLGRLVASLALDTVAFTGGLDKASYQAKQFERDVTRTFNQAAGAVKGFAGALVGGLGTLALGNQIKEAIDFADALGKAAQVAGVTANELGGLRSAAELGGVSAEAMDTSIKKLSQSMFDAAAGTEKQAQLFKALGVSVTDASGALLPASDVMMQIADQFAGMEDGAAKTALAVDLFGKSGAALIPMLNQGSEAMREQIQFFTDYVNVTDETVKSSELFNDTLTLISTVMQGVFMRAAEAILPPMQQLIEYLLGFVQQGSNASGVAEGLATAMKLVSSVLIGAIEGFRAVGTAIGGIAAAVSELASGNFKSAAGIIKQTFDDISKGVGNAATAVGKVWSGEANTAIATAARLTKAFDATTTAVEKKGKAAKSAADDLKKLEEAMRAPYLKLYKEGMEAAAYAVEEEAYWARESEKANKAQADAIMRVAKEAEAAADAEAQLIKQEKELADAAAKATAELQKRAAEDFQKQADSINKSLTDALLRGFESGKGFAENFAETLKNMFSTLVLRPIIQAVVAPVAGGINSMLGGLMGGGGGMGGMPGGGGLGGIMGGIFGSGQLPFVNGAGPILMPSGLGALGAGMMNPFTTISAGFGALTGGGGLSGALGAMGGAMGALGAALPIAGIGLALYSMFKKPRGGPKSGGYYGEGIDGERFFTPADQDEMVKGLVKGVTESYSQVLESLGGSGKLGLALGFDMDPKGTAQSRTSAVATVNGVEVYRNINAAAGRTEEEVQAALALESKRALLAALQASDLPDQIAAVLDSVTAISGTEEEIDRILRVATQVKALTDVIDQMADPVAAADEALANAGRTLYDVFIDARKGLLDLEEGFDGSAESLDELVAASNDYAKAQLALVIQIRALKGEIEGMFEDTATRIREQVMSEDELYAELQRQADAAFEAMLLATDPDEVAKYAAEINRLLERSFGLLSPEEQKAAAADYLANIERVNTAFQDKLDAMTDVLVEAGESDREFIQTALDEIVAKMTGAGETFEAGAATIAAAASRGVSVDISVSDRRVDYEVNG